MDFYVILGVERAASPSDVKRAYRRLARKHHPDINPGDAESEAFFLRVTEAYETLVDPERRQDYDQHGVRRGGPTDREVGIVGDVEFEGFDFSGPAPGGESASTFGDLFADVFAQSAGVRDRAASPGGIDLHAELCLPFEDAMRGGTHEITLTRVVHCGACRGTGARLVAEGRCAGCGGSGQSRWTRGHMVFSRQCAECGGSGRRRHRPCGACRAEGMVSRTESVGVPVPPGVTDGARLRVPGHGSATRGGRTGDLTISVTVEPHPLFRREGDDLHIVVPVAVHEAALGVRAEVPAIGGRATVRIPPGTQSGQRFRLRGRGAPSPVGAEPGDLVISVRIVLPQIIDERSKELMRELGRIHTEDVRAELLR
jgi:molecular chaperone DnaJ